MAGCFISIALHYFSFPFCQPLHLNPYQGIIFNDISLGDWLASDLPRSNFFQAKFDSQYFIITDPQNRRFGYTPNGFFNEIDNVTYQALNTYHPIQTQGSIAPITVENGQTYAIYNNHTNYETNSSLEECSVNSHNQQNSIFDVFISQPLSGEYKVEQINISDYNDNCTAITPEPSSVIGVLLTVFLGGWLRKKSRVEE